MKLREDVVLEPVSPDEAVALNLTDHRFYTMNETAVFIVERIRTGMAEDEIARKLAATFDVDEQDAANDVAAFLKALRDRDLVE